MSDSFGRSMKRHFKGLGLRVHSWRRRRAFHATMSAPESASYQCSDQRWGMGVMSGVRLIRAMYETALQRIGFVRTFVETASCISCDDESAGSRFVPVQRSSWGMGVMSGVRLIRAKYDTALQRFGFARTFVVTASCISCDDESAGSRFVPVQRSSLGYGVDERQQGWGWGRGGHDGSGLLQ